MLSVQFLGHACVAIDNQQHKLLIDPFLTGNDLAAVKADDVSADYILLTHGHGDHVGDTIPIAKRNDATVIACFELANYCGAQGVKVHPMHIGGAHQFDFGRVKLTHAQHGGGAGENADVYTGPPVGLLITINGKTIFHAGDTGLFGDMKLIGELNDIDLAFVPIGDNFTMGIDDAARAVDYLKPKKVVPIHYNTFPLIEQDPKEFASKVRGAEVVILEPGQSVSL